MSERGPAWRRAPWFAMGGQLAAAAARRACIRAAGSMRIVSPMQCAGPVRISPEFSTRRGSGRAARTLATFALSVATFALTASANPYASDADAYRDAVAKINDAHAAKPADADETALAKKLPKAATAALQRLLADPKVAPADLLVVGEAALDLDRVEDFEAIRAKLATLAPAEAPKLGIALSRPRFLLRGIDGVELPALTAIGDTLDLVLDAYRDVFHFTSWSKVPGKKLRVRVHLVPKIEKPPHFAPQFPWHSEIDFPVVSKDAFRSPTADGKFLLYGLCHELGHVIAMWGSVSGDEDHHAWAHYTGVVIVEHLAKSAPDAAVLRELRDAKWRTLSIERKDLEERKVKPGLVDRDAVLALLVGLHDLVGPAAVGDALNALDRGGKNQRVNRVRYYALRDFEAALVAGDAGRASAKAIAALFSGKR